MRDFSRRHLLHALTAIGAGSMAACRRYAGPAAVRLVPSGWTRGEERWVTTTCGQCPAGCGIRVRVYEGRAVKIEGNPAHPINGGGVGPKGQAGLQLLYHPDRIHGPLRRDGPRGSGRWRSITWDAAIGELADRLRDLRSAGEPQSLVVLDGEPRGLVPRLWERFLHAYGSPNHVTHASTSDGAQALAVGFMQGVPAVPAYDWHNTEYVIGFGVSLFESWCQTIHMSRATSAMRRGTPGRRVKFVHVSPRYSVTAAKADEWVSIEPGTEGALALGLAHVLVRDRLFDEAFVADRTFGFEDWHDGAGQTHRGFRTLLADYPPDTVARITGVPAETVERLAREMSGHRPAIALANAATGATTGALGTAMAIHALNALLGSIERPGGVTTEPSVLPAWPAPEPDAIASRGLACPRLDGGGTAACALGDGAIQHLPAAILAGRPYAAKALILYRSNPAFSKPDAARWIEAINRVPFVVSCSPLPDESTLWADLVLPDHTYLERSELVQAAPSSGRVILGLRQPVVPPRHDTTPTGDLIIRLAQRLEVPVAASFPWTNYQALVGEQAQDAAARLAVPGAAVDASAALARARQAGGWWGEAPARAADAALPTPSRKFEFYAQAIASRLATSFDTPAALDACLSAGGVAARGDELCLPHWEPPRFVGDAREYPFVVLPYRAINYAEGGVRHLPFLRELPEGGLLAWKETIELNPEDARRLDVDEGDPVWVESPVGRRRLCVRVMPGTRVGTVALPLGHGPWPVTTADAGTTGAHGLLAAASDPLSGTLAYLGTRARIRKEAS